MNGTEFVDKINPENSLLFNGCVGHNTKQKNQWNGV